LRSAAIRRYPIGYFHTDIAEARTEKDKLYLFVAVHRTAKFALAALHEKADRPGSSSTPRGDVRKKSGCAPYRAWAKSCRAR
jgi:hypothetical protein